MSLTTPTNIFSVLEIYATFTSLEGTYKVRFDIETGDPFFAATKLVDGKEVEITNPEDIGTLKTILRHRLNQVRF